MRVFLILRVMLYIFNNYFNDIYFEMIKYGGEKSCSPMPAGCIVMERKVMKKSTGKYNSMVPTEHNSREDYMQREIHFLNGQTVKLKAGNFAVTVDTRSQGGYNKYMLSL